jgi:chemotaxis methyl-accepting protein methylase
MNDQQFRQLLSHFGFSWEGYRKVRRGVKKRVARHMQETSCRALHAYFLLLHEDKGARLHFNRLMTVSISRFFRDRRLWEVLETKILPGLIQKNQGKVKIWSAGCACGEEVYSLKLVWERLQRHFQAVPQLELLATDVNPVYLSKAQSGVYPQSSLKEVPETIRKAYFRPIGKEKKYAVIERLKEGIYWREHNLLLDAPGTSFHLVFLRNSLLTYYEDELEIPAFQNVINSMARGGLLIIGSHESIPSGDGEIIRSRLHPNVYEKRF